MSCRDGKREAMTWISVEDRSPEVGKDVLTWHRDRCHVGSLEYDDEMDRNEWFIPTSGDWEPPSHWMPLPEPPEIDPGPMSPEEKRAADICLERCEGVHTINLNSSNGDN